MYHRIIAKLDIKGPNLVKGIHLEGLRVLGSPAEFTKYYANNGADEILYMDVVASLYERNSIHQLITETAKQAFVPITVGGGLRTIEDIKAVLRAGADKVAINTAAVRKPDFIRQASRYFGSSTIAVTIEAIKHEDGHYYAYTDNGREATGREVVCWAEEVESLGAGEIVITSVDKEGTGQGFDLMLTKCIAEKVGIPVVACGGAGSIEHVKEVFLVAKADAVAVASMFHYNYLPNIAGCSVNQTQEGNIEFLISGETYKKVIPASILDVKEQMNSAGIGVRI